MFATGDFRPLQTVLDLHGEGDDTITINQPAGTGRRQAIVVALLDNAPPDKRPMLEEAIVEW
jgi:hypothetical protein